ncbi:MAG: hypothetical protein IJ574_02650 [Bacilli bacterium]|nr:hypothetical protein [Bacilli bacterium]
MRIKYKMLLTIILLLIVGVVIIGFDYKTELKEKEELVSKVSVIDGLSINYVNGEEITTSKKSDEIYFSLTNLSDTEKRYNVYLLDIQKDGDNITYYLSQSNTLGSNDYHEFTGKDERLITEQVINSNENNSYKINIYNPEEKNLKFRIYVEPIK